jgi:hydrogenase expression/formation protein HypE
VEETALPVSAQVRDFCGLLGLDPLYMGNEGKLVAILPEAQGALALDILRQQPYGKDAALIGRVENGTPGQLSLTTAIGGRRLLDVLQGEGLPRIC